MVLYWNTYPRPSLWLDLWLQFFCYRTKIALTYIVWWFNRYSCLPCYGIWSLGCVDLSMKLLNLRSWDFLCWFQVQTWFRFVGVGLRMWFFLIYLIFYCSSFLVRTTKRVYFLCFFIGSIKAWSFHRLCINTIRCWRDPLNWEDCRIGWRKNYVKSRKLKILILISEAFTVKHWNLELGAFIDAKTASKALRCEYLK